MMEINAFWALIERVRGGADTDIEQRIERLEGELRTLSTDEVAEYARHFDEQLHRAYTWNVRGAAHCIMGGCSDDSFWDFRSGLIASGRELFERALTDPDTLATLSEAEIENLYAEGFQYPAGTVYKEMTGQELPPSQHGGVPLQAPAGERWSDEDDLKCRFPKLYKRFCED
jgi:hypothetical protein